MIRAFVEFIANMADLVRGGVPTLVFFSFLAALIVGVLWYFWPRWLPWTWRWRWGRSDRSGRDRRGWRNRFRLGRLRWRIRLRWRRRRRGQPEEPMDLPPDELPDLPAEVLVLTADQLAAAGRYAEAVRERLRAMVRELIERDIIPFSPGWTVTELAYAATRTEPALTGALSGAVGVFSEIWYGLRPALADDDAAMRGYAAELSRTVAARTPVAS